MVAPLWPLLLKNPRSASAPGAPLLSKMFNFSFVLNLASGYENMNDHLLLCGAVVALSTEKSVKSCNVDDVKSLARDEKKQAAEETLNTDKCVSFIRS